MQYQPDFTADKARENARKGGIASGEARRKYKSQREILRHLLTLEVADQETADKLRELGLDPTYAQQMALAILTKGGTGDVEAARFVRDTVGEKPTENYNLGVQGKPIKALDLSKLSDEELEALADQAEE